jgi:hypothetical protein
LQKRDGNVRVQGHTTVIVEEDNRGKGDCEAITIFLSGKLLDLMYHSIASSYISNYIF